MEHQDSVLREIEQLVNEQRHHHYQVHYHHQQPHPHPPQHPHHPQHPQHHLSLDDELAMHHCQNQQPQHQHHLQHPQHHQQQLMHHVQAPPPAPAPVQPQPQPVPHHQAPPAAPSPPRGDTANNQRPASPAATSPPAPPQPAKVSQPPPVQVQTPAPAPAPAQPPQPDGVISSLEDKHRDISEHFTLSTVNNIKTEAGVAPAGEEAKQSEPPEVCRVCLADDKDNLQCIFSGGVSDQVRAVAAVDLDKDDGLPQFICFDCRSDLAIAIKFKTKCESSDADLRNRLGIKMKTVVKTELVLLDCDDVQIVSDEEKKRKSPPLPELLSSEEEILDNYYRSSDPDYEDDDDDEPRPKKKKHGRGRKKSESFRAELGDSIHITIKKSKDGTYPCPYCDKSFQYPSTLKLHLPTHRNKMSKCVLCSLTFGNQKELYDHYRRDHPNECNRVQTGTLSCDMCTERFFSADALSAHERSRHGVNRYRCEKCPQTFNNLTSLNQHKRQDHSKPYQCRVCDKRFKHASSMEKHCENYGHRPRKGYSREEERKPMSTKDLFKSIAPLTTTYWSDSFSD